MSMKKLTINQTHEKERVELLSLYKNLPLEKMFPLIGSKLLNSKSVYRLIGLEQPIYLIISSLGFCQLIYIGEKPVSRLSIHDILYHSKEIFDSLSIQKFRFYPSIGLNNLVATISSPNISMSQRRRYKPSEANNGLINDKMLDKDYALYLPSNIECIKHLIPQEFIHRFWYSWDKFIEHSSPFVLISKGNFACICYSAAIFNGFSEIDVYTAEAHRNKGLAKYAATNYIRHLRELSVTALWDCFSNNQGSISLAESLSLEQQGNDYCFYTVNRV